MCEELDPRWVGAAIQREFWHFYSQLYQRYGIVLAPGEFKMIRRAISGGAALMVERREGKQAIYSVRIPSAGERVYILAAGRHLITAWPPERRLNKRRRELLTVRSKSSAIGPASEQGLIEGV